MRILYTILLLALTTLNTHAQRKLSPMVRQTMEKAEKTNAAKGSAVKERYMNALVRTGDTGVLRKNGCKVLASFGDIHITTIPISNLRRLAANDAIKRIEAGPRHTALLDSAAYYVNISPVWNNTVPTNNGSVKMDGRGVVLGIMDIGFDLTHPGFYSADMKNYRIKALWDQLDQSEGGAAVTGKDTTYLGRQYVGQEQLQALGHSYDGFIMTHGTSTLYIATGNGTIGAETGIGSGYKGMATGADLCLVANATGNNSELIPVDMYDMYNTTLDLLGFKYIFDYAEAHHQPCVISFSEGSYPGMYTNDLLYAEVLQSLVGPGRIICSSAGNESYRHTHLDKPLGKAEASAFAQEAKDLVYYTMKSSGEATVRLTFYANDGTPVVREYSTMQCYAPNDDDPFFEEYVNVNGKDYLISLCSYRSSFNNDDWVMEIVIMDEHGGYVGREAPVMLTLLGSDIHSELYSSGGYFTHNNLNPDAADYDNTHNVNMPSCLPSVICVGSVNSRSNYVNIDGKEKRIYWGEGGLHSGFSSTGPTMYDGVKPDVCAPGSSIITALNSFYYECNKRSNDISTFYWQDRTYPWSIDCGTSYSCPMVSGIIAIWLQACPTLSPEQVMEVIANTATKPADFLSYETTTDEHGYTKNNYYGYGVIDAAAGLEYIGKTYTGIQDITTAQHDSDNTYDLMGRRVASLRHGNIYIRNGKKVIIR